MADLSIRKDFLDGIEEVFSSLFNEGVGDDGIQLFQYVDGEDNIYQEQKFKRYSNPITLIASVREPEVNGETNIEAQKRKAVFKVPTKNLIENGIIDMDKPTIIKLRKGIIKYKDVFYDIDLIQGKIFIENIYVAWEFQCTEIYDPDIIQLLIEEPETFNLTFKEED